MTERIVAAAIQVVTVYAAQAPSRHYDILRANPDLGMVEHTQGFLTDAGRFVDRAAALAIAREAGQIPPDHPAPMGQLYSEDLW